MALPDLPTEIILNIYCYCSSISSAMNLSLTCRRLHHLLQASHKISVLFAIAERVWGPLQDVYQILTYNSSQPVHVKRKPVQSLSLLVQVSRIGRVGTWYETMYPQIRWDGPKAHLRRALTPAESRSLRSAIYRMWLFSRAFHTSNTPRTMRMNTALIANRCQLLKTFSTNELVELEDTRMFVENLMATICPTNGEVYWRSGTDFLSFEHYRQNNRRSTSISAIFHDAHTESADRHANQPASEIREQTMEGWGDDVQQYHALMSLLKLNPEQIVRLYETALTKRDVEKFVEESCGGVWFWDNGEAMIHAWLLVMYRRGLPVQDIRERIYCGFMGISTDDATL